jgi:hypothetical protein
MSKWSSYKEQQLLHEGWRRFLNEGAERAKIWNEYNPQVRHAIENGELETAEKLLVHLEIEVFINAIAEMGRQSSGPLIPNADIHVLAPKLHEAGPRWCALVAKHMKETLRSIYVQLSPGNKRAGVNEMNHDMWMDAFKGAGIPEIPEEWTEDHCARVLQHSKRFTSDMDTVDEYRQNIKDKAPASGPAVPGPSHPGREQGGV